MSVKERFIDVIQKFQTCFPNSYKEVVGKTELTGHILLDDEEIKYIGEQLSIFFNEDIQVVKRNETTHSCNYGVVFI